MTRVSNKCLCEDEMPRTRSCSAKRFCSFRTSLLICRPTTCARDKPPLFTCKESCRVWTSKSGSKDCKGRGRLMRSFTCWNPGIQVADLWLTTLRDMGIASRSILCSVIFCFACFGFFAVFPWGMPTWLRNRSTWLKRDVAFCASNSCAVMRKFFKASLAPCREMPPHFLLGKRVKRMGGECAIPLPWPCIILHLPSDSAGDLQNSVVEVGASSQIHKTFFATQWPKDAASA